MSTLYMEEMQNSQSTPENSVMHVKGLTERTLLKTSTRQIVTIFLLSALSYMLGVAWYEVARTILENYESNNPHLTKLELMYRFAAAVTVFVLIVAIAIHYITRLHVIVN